MYTPPPNRILNRHRRGRPKFHFFRRFVSRLKRLIVPLVIVAVVSGGYYLLRVFGVL